MPTLNVQQYFSVLINGELKSMGSQVRPAGIVLDSPPYFYDKNYSVAAGITQDLWTASTDGGANPKFIGIECDFDLMLELTTDVNASIGTSLYTIGLLGSGVANQYGPIDTITRNASYANYTVNFGGGTLDQIERIRCKNLAVSQTSQVHIWVLK